MIARKTHTSISLTFPAHFCVAVFSLPFSDHATV